MSIRNLTTENTKFDQNLQVESLVANDTLVTGDIISQNLEATNSLILTKELFELDFTTVVPGDEIDINMTGMTAEVRCENYPGAIPTTALNYFFVNISNPLIVADETTFALAYSPFSNMGGQGFKLSAQIHRYIDGVVEIRILNNSSTDVTAGNAGTFGFYLTIINAPS
jgi:hypothetical protein